MKKQDWEIYQGNAQKDVLFTQLAYTDKEEKQANYQELAAEIAPNHELFLYSDYMDDTKGFEYRCAVFIDRENKQIVCANAGTRLKANSKGANDLIDDGNLILHLEPRKLQSAKILNETILDNLGAEISEYKFHFTGHSLGAAMAQMQATDLFLQMRQRDIKPLEISTITFDNPGAQPIIEKMLKKENLNPETVDINHIVVNNRPNFINTLNAQAGEVFELVPDNRSNFLNDVNSNIKTKFEKNMPQGGRVFDILKDNVIPLISEVVSWFIPKSVKILAKVVNFLATAKEQIQDHKLENFSDVIVKGQGGIMFKAGQQISLENLIKTDQKSLSSKGEYVQKLFSELSDLKKVNPSVGKQDFVIDNPANLREKITYSLNELEAARKKVFQKSPELKKSQSSGRSNV